MAKKEEVVQLHDNTEVKGLRHQLTTTHQKFTERMDRLEGAVQDAIGEFQKETRESMANRVDDGFSAAEATKFAKATAEIYEMVLKGLDAIKKNTRGNLVAIVGSNAMTVDAANNVSIDVTMLDGILSAVSIGVEQDQLKFVTLPDSKDVVEGDEPPKV